MKKTAAFILGCGLCLAPVRGWAQMAYLDEVRALGAVAGQGLACGASKYDTFELLARAILISKAVSNNMQAEGMYAYNEEKANAYMSKQYDGLYDCDEINRRFDRQAIFKMTLYADGTLKMPDGTIVTPRQPYDASLIYRKEGNPADNAKSIYDGGAKLKVGDIQIKALGEDGAVQTVYQNASGGAEAAVASGMPSVKPSQRVAPAPAPDSGGIGHVKGRWR